MSVTTVHLVRHGEVENPDHILYERLEGFPLSERGERMAAATGEFMASFAPFQNVAHVVSSPLERTRQTAQIITDRINTFRQTHHLPALVCHTDERLIEASNEFRGTRIGYGQGALWRPKNWKLIANLHKPSWGESYEHIAQRMHEAVLDLVDAHPGQQVLAVSHESPIWSLRMLLEQGSPEHWMFARRTALASITSLSFDCDSHELLSISYANPAADVA